MKKVFIIASIIILIIIILLLNFLTKIAKKKVENNSLITPSPYIIDENLNYYENNYPPEDLFQEESSPELLDDKNLDTPPTPTPNSVSKNISDINLIYKILTFDFLMPKLNNYNNKTKTSFDILKSKLPIKTNYFNIESFDDLSNKFRLDLKEPKDENLKIFENWLKIEYPDININNFLL